MQIIKKIFSIVLRVGISAALLFILFRKIDFKSTLIVISHLNFGYFTFAAVIFLAIYALVFYRWRMLLKAQDLNLPTSRILSSFSGGIFFSLFLPSTIGGDVARTLDLSLHTKKRSVVAASVLLDRLSGFVGLVLVAIVSLIFGHKLIVEPEVYFVVLILSALLAAVLLIIFNKRIYKRLNRKIHKDGSFWDNFRKLHAEIFFFRSQPSILYLNLLYSILIQSGSSVVAYFLLRSLNVKIHIIYPLVFSPVITVITTLPVSIGGLGLRDASSIFFYTKVGVLKNVALAQSLLNFALIVATGLIGGIIYVSTFHYRRLQPDQTGAQPE